MKHVQPYDGGKIMKNIAMFFAALFCLCSVASTSNAVVVNVEVGDQPYYVHGPGYWAGGAYLVWVPGHWGAHHHWVHGHYARR